MRFEVDVKGSTLAENLWWAKGSTPQGYLLLSDWPAAGEGVIRPKDEASNRAFHTPRNNACGHPRIGFTMNCRPTKQPGGQLQVTCTAATSYGKVYTWKVR